MNTPHRCPGGIPPPPSASDHSLAEATGPTCLKWVLARLFAGGAAPMLSLTAHQPDMLLPAYLATLSWARFLYWLWEV